MIKVVNFIHHIWGPVALKGCEVVLELLGMKESVELLAAVACIDADQTPPCCLEIAQLVLLICCHFAFSQPLVCWYMLVWSFTFVLEHRGEFNPHFRQWLGGGDP